MDGWMDVYVYVAGEVTDHPFEVAEYKGGVVGIATFPELDGQADELEARV